MENNVNSDNYRKFCQTIIDTIKKNGFPDKKVSLPLERVREIADKRGIDLTEVLNTLDEIQIASEITPEKIIFFPKVEEEDNNTPEAAPNTAPFQAFAAEASNAFQSGNLSDAMAAASRVLERMSPDQLASVKEMYDNMSEEERAELLKTAEKLGLFHLK
ncbi:MAG: hypothetical protein QNJ97_11745 [Myxococcota bacterium]|nr:hypothetical protein [Myxococcota bacterium]